MTIHMVTVAAAAHSDQNVLTDAWIEESKYLRRLKRIGIAGGATSVTKAVFYYGQREAAQVYNYPATDSCPTQDDMWVSSSKMVCLPGEELSLILNGTTATNPLEIVIEMEEIPFPRRRYGRRRRGFGRRRRYGYRRRY